MAKEFEANCPKHGLTTFVLASPDTESERKRCKLCRTEAVQRRRWKVKEKAILYLGGKCGICGYDKCVAALHFHHKDPSDKEFGISQKGATRSWSSIVKELDKCELMCANCHAEQHFIGSEKPFDFERVCSTCGENFISENTKKKYCSDTCRNRRSRPV